MGVNSYSLQPNPLTSVWLLLSVQVDVFRQNLFQEVSRWIQAIRPRALAPYSKGHNL